MLLNFNYYYTNDMKCYQTMPKNVIAFYALHAYMQLDSTVWDVEPYYSNMLTNKKMLQTPAWVLSSKRNMWALDNMFCSVI